MSDFVGTTGDNIQAGTNDADTFDYSQGGNDTLSGLDGSDTFTFGAAFDENDHVDGGSGTDTLLLNGDYSSAALWTATNLTAIEEIHVAGGHSYSLHLDDSVTSSTLTIDGHTLGAADSLTVDFSSESDAQYTVIGGKGDDVFSAGAFHAVLRGKGGNDDLRGGSAFDTLDGGKGDDTLFGQGGDDLMKGGKGNDHYHIGVVADSTSTSFDEFVGFDANGDVIGLQGVAEIDGVDATVAQGKLNGGTHFDEQLQAAVGAGQLAPHHAVLFTPSSGTLGGATTFLVIDGNNTAGYQAGEDYVVMLTDARHLGHLGVADFELFFT